MLRSAKSEPRTLAKNAGQQLRQSIAQGMIRSGSELPTEAELCQMLGVLRTFVREALRLIKEDGLVARRHGVGTFVRDHPILNNLNFNIGITEMIESAGLTLKTSYFVIRSEIADQEKAEQLRVPVWTALNTVERVRTTGGWLSIYYLDMFTEFLIQRAQTDLQLLRSQAIYDMSRSSPGKVIEYGIARLIPVAAPDLVAEKFELPPYPLTRCIVQTDNSPDDEPLVYSQEYHLPDAFEFIVWRRGPTKTQGLSAKAAR